MTREQLFALDEEGVKTSARLNKVGTRPGEGQTADGSRQPRGLGATVRPVQD